jgi:hypothetical protein
MTMKKIILSAAIVLSAAAFNDTSAQVRLNVNINVGSQPDWGPVGYDRADYYYMPDIETYYYVPDRQFIYLSGGRWVFSSNLPRAHRNYNLYNGYKVVVNQPRAYQYHQTHRTQYAKYRGNRGQGYIKNSHDPRYKQNNNRNNRNRNGNNNGRGNGRGRN